MENQKPLVSVLMPCYNHEKYVAQSIESILNQTYANIELIVADNGSTDGSYEVIQQYQDKIRILHLDQNDLLKAILMLHDTSRGEYVAIATSDDYWEPDKIELQMEVFEKYPNVMVCTTQAVSVDENSTFLEEPSQSVFAQKNRSRGEWMKYLVLCGNRLAYPSAVMKRETYRRVSVEWERGYKQVGDLFYWLRILLEGGEIYVVQKTLVKFRWHLADENRNLSAPTQENEIRFGNEIADAVLYVFENISDDFFREAFGSEMIDPKASSAEEIIFEKLLLLLKLAEGKHFYQTSVMRFYYNNFAKINENKELMQKYHFSCVDFDKWSGQAGMRKMEYDMATVLSRCDEYKKRLNLLQDAYLKGKEGEEYEQSISKLKKIYFLSIPDENQKTISLTCEHCENVLALWKYLDAVEYKVVIDALWNFAESIDRVWNDLQYLQWGITEDDWTLFKQLIQMGMMEKIDLEEAVFPFLKLIGQKLQVYVQ